MIETLGGPIIAMILFLMPMYAIQKVPAMRKYSGHISNVFVVIMGLIAISAIFTLCSANSFNAPRAALRRRAFRQHGNTYDQRIRYL